MLANVKKRKQAIKYFCAAMICIAVIMGVGLIAVKKLSAPKNIVTDQEDSPNFVALDTPELKGSVESQAIVEQQNKTESQAKQIEDLKKEIEDLKARSVDQNTLSEANNSKLQQSLIELQQQLETAGRNRASTASGTNINANGGGIQSFDLSFNLAHPQKFKTSIANYVPSNTIAKAVLLGGVEANASVEGQTNTAPVVFRILDNGDIPTQITHGHSKQLRSSLKGCRVLASAYGDISDERGHIRLVRLSCVRANGDILDVPVEGTVSEGVDGIKGTPIMRNGPILWDATLASAIRGIGNGLQQQSTTQSVTPLGGTTTTVSPNKILQYGLFGGAEGAAQTLADYYVKKANMYHPVIEIHPGAIVTVIFTKGFSLDVTDQAQQAAVIADDSPSTNTASTNDISAAQALVHRLNNKSSDDIGSSVGIQQ